MTATLSRYTAARARDDGSDLRHGDVVAAFEELRPVERMFVILGHEAPDDPTIPAAVAA